MERLLTRPGHEEDVVVDPERDKEDEHQQRTGRWDPRVAKDAVEAELTDLEPGDRTAFLADLGLAEPGLNRVARAAYELLELITFFTAGENEVRAWTLSRGGSALDAAATIHTDFARGFIRAEVINVDDLLAAGSYNAVREQGKQRLEGRDYIVRDGDVVHFRFNV